MDYRTHYRTKLKFRYLELYDMLLNGEELSKDDMVELLDVNFNTASRMIRGLTALDSHIKHYTVNWKWIYYYDEDGEFHSENATRTTQVVAVYQMLLNGETLTTTAVQERLSISYKTALAILKSINEYDYHIKRVRLHPEPDKYYYDA